jgi:hypothetical protein
MRFLQHVMNETLRLYPDVPFNMRVSLTDTTLPRGGGSDGTHPIGVPKLTAVGYSTLLLQRREQIYADQGEGFPDPRTFAPRDSNDGRQRPGPTFRSMVVRGSALANNGRAFYLHWPQSNVHKLTNLID